MAKELPYFKFEFGEWDNGNIQMCNLEEKGLFIDLCSLFWARLGDLPEKLAVQKVCGGNATALNSLIEAQVIKVKDGKVFIEFLLEQLEEFEYLSSTNKKNAISGWENRRKNATALNPQSGRIAMREEKRREEENIEEDKIKNILILDKKLTSKESNNLLEDMLIENFNKPNSFFLGLEIPKSTKELALLKIKQSTGFNDASFLDVENLWDIFKKEFFNGEKYYSNATQIYSHFGNWVKFQKIPKNNKPKEINKNVKIILK